MAKVTVGPDGTITADTGGQPAAKAKWDKETIAVSGALLKSGDELRSTLNLIYPADKADIGKALDGHRDFASKDVVRKACWEWTRNSRKVGAFHTEEQAAAAGTALKSEDAADCVESYIYEGPDWDIAGTVIKAGDWLGRFVWTPEYWELIKAGEIGGVSVEGKAVRKPASPDAIAKLRN